MSVCPDPGRVGVEQAIQGLETSCFVWKKSVVEIHQPEETLKLLLVGRQWHVLDCVYLLLDGVNPGGIHSEAQEDDRGCPENALGEADLESGLVEQVKHAEESLVVGGDVSSSDEDVILEDDDTWDVGDKVRHEHLEDAGRRCDSEGQSVNSVQPQYRIDGQEVRGGVVDAHLRKRLVEVDLGKDCRTRDLGKGVVSSWQGVAVGFEHFVHGALVVAAKPDAAVGPVDNDDGRGVADRRVWRRRDCALSMQCMDGVDDAVLRGVSHRAGGEVLGSGRLVPVESDGRAFETSKL